ncbi:hypothetical protein E8D37_10510 [Nocardioides sp. GY 10127]|nr:hypothetical protein E8D37_10510 [Nocardioides sp. GY 10127]
MTDFGLGGADSATLYEADLTTVVDTYSWTAHATTTYGRCPDGTGEWVTTAASTKGAANDCVQPLVINEVESSGGDPGDWIELRNNTDAALDISGYVLKDSDDTHAFVVPDATTIDAGGYYVAEVDASFGLGSSDSARLFEADGTTLVDSYTWTAHADTTYGRCPDGTGDFATTAASTKGAANLCEGDLVTRAWPGGTDVTAVDDADLVTTNLSGLAYEASGTSEPGTLWAVQNGPGTLFRLEQADDGQWLAADGDWASGVTLHYADGTGNVDAEGVAIADGSADGGVYVSTERDNDASSVSRPSVLRYDVSAGGTTLDATTEWNLAGDLPTLGANSGLEGIAWLPDADLVAAGFVDATTGEAYDPADYPGHGDGLFAVGVEGTGGVYVYALAEDGSYTRVADFASGFDGVMDLDYDGASQTLYVVCDDACEGVIGEFAIASEGDDAGTFVADVYDERPAGMANLANEGFTVAAAAECADGLKPAFWADDSDTDGYSLREGTVECDTEPAAVVDPTISASVSPAVPASGWYTGPVTVSFTCVEGSAALVDACPEDVVLDEDGADQSVTASIEATDGGTATVTSEPVSIDATAPVVRLTKVAAGQTYRGVRTPSCVASDATSGLAGECEVTVREGSNGWRVATASATDVAGNTASVSRRYRVLTAFVRGASQAGAGSGAGSAFRVGRGDRATLVVWVPVGRSAPTLLAATRAGSPHAALGRMGATGTAQDGWAEYEAVVRLPSAKAGTTWRYGVRSGGDVSLLAVRLTR